MNDISTDTGGPESLWPLPDLVALVRGCLTSTGLSADVAQLVADSLVDAQARGIASHGVSRTRIYAERIRAGLIDPLAEPRVIHRRGGSFLIDARNAIGHAGAAAAVRQALNAGADEPLMMIGVRNSNHCGTLGFFARKAAAAGKVTIAMSTAPVTMAYFGGRSRAVGTNPLCICIPRAGGPPVTIDMATSATARGKIILAEKLGQDIPSGWAVDLHGRPTLNAQEALAGAVLPFAGPKGSGLAMAIDLLAGAMTGSPVGPDIGDMYEDWTRPQKVGHLFIFLDGDQWLGGGSLSERASSLGHYVHSLPPGAGFTEVQLPGEVEQRRYERALNDGVHVPEAVVDDLRILATELANAEVSPSSSPDVSTSSNLDVP